MGTSYGELRERDLTARRKKPRNLKEIAIIDRECAVWGRDRTNQSGGHTSATTLIEAELQRISSRMTKR